MTALASDGYFHEVSPARKPSDLRASDHDRERVVTVLADAVADGRLTLEEHSQRVQRAYQARTLGELASLTTDLVSPAGQPLQLDDSRSVTAFFATTQRDGRWVVPDRLTVAAMGGQVILDLRQALLQGAHTVIQATLLGGQLHLHVPDGVQVTVISARQPGRARGELAPRQAPAVPPGSALIEVRTFSVGGRVHVHGPRRPRARWGGRFARRDPGPRGRRCRPPPHRCPNPRSSPGCGPLGACSPRTRRGCCWPRRARPPNCPRWWTGVRPATRWSTSLAGRISAACGSPWIPGSSCPAAAPSSWSARPSRSPRRARSSWTCAAVLVPWAPRSPPRWTAPSCTPPTSTRPPCAAPAATSPRPAARSTRATCSSR